MSMTVVARRLAMLAAVHAALLLVLVPGALAGEVTSDGPLTRIITTPDLACQVAHRDDEAFEFFPSESEVGSCGTFAAVGDTVYGPLGVSATQTPWTPVSQSPTAGSGSASDPFRIVTVVGAPAAGLRLTQTDSYVLGSQSYRTDIEIANTGGQPSDGVVYRAGDCFLQGDDRGFVRVDDGAPACVVDPAEGRRIEQWLPLTSGSHFYAGFFGQVWTLVGTGEQFPDTCECAATAEFDNGAGLSWPLNIAPGQTVTVSHETFFSPVGRGAVAESFRDSVPDPTAVSLDPIVVAQSVAIAAGVVLLVPFPSALFNSTLEQNYDEVMAGVVRLRTRLAKLLAAIMGGVRARVAARRARRGSREPVVEEPVIAAPPARAPEEGMPPPSRDLWRTPLGMAAFIGASALLYGFLDPTFGFSISSLGTLAGLALGLFVVVAAYGLPLLVFARRNGLGISPRALPATLLVGVGCVVVSRLADFQPGYLYGLIIGFFFAANVDRRAEGRAEALATAASLAVAFVAWVLLALLRSGAGPTDESVAPLVQAATVTVVVAGLENAVFAMLPLRFLPGAAVYAWSRRVWIALLGLGVFGFAHVLLNPSAGYLADTTRTSFFTLVALLAAFALVSVLFWGWFRFRRTPEAAT